MNVKEIIRPDVRETFFFYGPIVSWKFNDSNRICESQKQIGWGNNALEQLANDLKNDYPKVKGFSPRNCRCMIQFHKEYNQELTIWQPVVAN